MTRIFLRSHHLWNFNSISSYQAYLYAPYIGTDSTLELFFSQRFLLYILLHRLMKMCLPKSRVCCTCCTIYKVWYPLMAILTFHASRENKFCVDSPIHCDKWEQEGKVERPHRLSFCDLKHEVQICTDCHFKLLNYKHY